MLWQPASSPSIGSKSALDRARFLGAITGDYSEEDVSLLTALKDLIGGCSPDNCIDPVGLEAQSKELQGI